MIITTPDDTPILDAERIAALIDRVFGTNSATIHPADSYVAVNPANESPFAVSPYAPALIGMDGSEGQNLRLASALRAALPKDFPRIVAVEAEKDAYVDLTAGITPEEIRDQWRPLSEGGFE